MNERLLREIIEISTLKKKPSETAYFARLSLPPLVILWGCMRISEWLRIQSIALQIRPLELDASSKIDKACITLMESADFLGEMFQLNENRLEFAGDISPGEAKAAIEYARSHDSGPLFVTPKRGVTQRKE